MNLDLVYDVKTYNNKFKFICGPIHFKIFTFLSFDQ